MTIEERRLQCEVRHVLILRKRGGEAAAKYLEGVAEKRGVVHAAELRDHCAEQWRRGNRGATGDWRDG